MAIEQLDSYVDELMNSLRGKTRDEALYAVGRLVSECLGEFDDGAKYQQSALMNFIADTYNQSNLSPSEKELQAEPYRLALEALWRNTC